MRRRDWQKVQTRLDLALAAFELAKMHGLAQVRVPQIAEAVGVSTRTFNNYFASKEAAIVWPSTLRGARLASDVAERPAGEQLADALVAVVAGLYGPAGQEGLPEGWLDGFRALVAAEPALHGEYLKSQAAGERALAETIAARTGSPEGALEPLLIAGMVTAAERAAVLHWFGQAEPSASLVELVRAALTMALGGMTAAAVALS
jgi:AcrR family transcriptional regulator